MYTFDSTIVNHSNGKYMAVIFMVTDEPNYDTVKEKELSSESEAAIWIDDELSRMTTGKGVWE